ALTYYVPTKDFPLNRWLRSWAVNFHAPFVLSQLALAEMIPRRTGAIVNISSGAAIGPGRGPYPDPAIGARGGTCYGAEKAPLEKVSGRVTYSQQILKEFGWISDARGRGVEMPGSGYSQI